MSRDKEAQCDDPNNYFQYVHYPTKTSLKTSSAPSSAAPSPPQSDGGLGTWGTIGVVCFVLFICGFLLWMLHLSDKAQAQAPAPAKTTKS